MKNQLQSLKRNMEDTYPKRVLSAELSHMNSEEEVADRRKVGKSKAY